ncbi:MAG: ornithine carbamoyltransferase [Alphaproteobacteria bacterium]|nr:ornithine carbamoyltransferase [Alphaproteobacteria bacterium]
MSADSSAEVRHFLDLDRLDAGTLRQILDLGSACKRDGAFVEEKPLAGRQLAMIFEKPSTRTRVSFEVGMRQLGGQAVILEQQGSQLGRGETVADTARVLCRYVDVIMLRTTREENLLELAENSTVPVINGLTNRTHPCQLMADVMTFEEHLGPIKDRRVAWCGDGNNMATSWIHAAVRFEFELRVATPEELQPPQAVLDWAAAHGGRIVLGNDVEAAVDGADCVVTDVWTSMGDDETESFKQRRHNLLAGYRVDERVMRIANDDAIFMHCLPAHRGEEVAAEVIDGPRSVVWDEAENRLHAQKGILLWCLT